MEITAAVAADLATLTQALDDPDVDLEHTVRQLGGTAAGAVDSYLGLSITIGDGDYRPTLVALEESTDPGEFLASLTMPLPRTSSDVNRDSSLDIVVTLYAGTRGAFVDLAADLSWITGDPLDVYRLDDHLTADPNTPSDLTGLSIINQAIGVLIARGHTLERAQHELVSRAARAGGDRLAAAHQVLDDTEKP